MIDRIVVINDLSDPQGGASFLALQSARGFAERGVAVSFLSGDEQRTKSGDGIEFVNLNQQRLLAAGKANAILRGIYNASARDMVAGWIARNDTPGTVYHVHGWSQILSPSIFSALAAVAGRIVMTAHDFFLTCPNGAQFDFRSDRVCPHTPLDGYCLAASCDRRSYAQKLWRCSRQFVQNRLVNRSEFPPQLLIHAGMAQYFRRAGLKEGDMIVLPNPVTSWSAERVVAEDNRQVLFVGRMEKTKGIDLAAEACLRAGVQLSAVGDGALLRELRQQYPEHVFHGRLPPDMIGEFAAKARFLIMPSRHMEPFGLTAVEALWSGLPVLSSNRGLITPDIVETGAGLEIDPLDVDAMARQIEKLAGDDALLREMSHRAYYETGRLALRPGDWLDALVEVYEAMLDGGKPALRAVAATWGSSRSPSETPISVREH